ncbi:uncharacterized protein LOC113850462 isoform X2 [Abrus precatorius]|uniref:Uncharacterized protein LOC113850462 isoform X2 n=1 Tax=Abrus precatorius TaxID=3816 RepID=A0A8B8JZD3_ABRPR|nr:uncharacterized protein LOC113850462 isoform X2 [Abrus precatorius]
MASTNLLRSGASIFNRLSKSLLQSNNSNLLPSLRRLPIPENDAESPNKLVASQCQWFLYPCGLPSLPFFLPDGDVSSSDDSMLLFPKRTFQPSLIRRKRNHGFFARNVSGPYRVNDWPAS